MLRRQPKMLVERPRNPVVSRPKGVATSHGLGGSLLRTHTGLSLGRKVWAHVSNSPRSRISTRKYCGRLRPRNDGVLHSVIAHGTGVTEGTGDTSAARTACEDRESPRHRAYALQMRGNRKNAEIVHPITAAQTKRRRVSSASTHYSLITTHGARHG